MLDSLDRVDHTDIFAHLESCLSKNKFQILQALFAEALKELHRVLEAALSNLDAILEFVKC